MGFSPPEPHFYGSSFITIVRDGAELSNYGFERCTDCGAKNEEARTKPLGRILLCFTINPGHGNLCLWNDRMDAQAIF